MSSLSTSLAGRTLADLLSEFPTLDKMPGSSIQAQFVPFRTLFLSALQQADPSDSFGCVGAFLSPSEYASYQELAPGTAAEVWQRKLHPGDLAPAASPVDLYIHNIALDAFNNEGALLTALQLKLHLALPAHMQSGFLSAISGVARFGSPAQQWAKVIDLIGPLTATSVAKEHALLLTAYRAGTPLQEFFEVHDACHRFRSMVKMPYSQYEMYDHAYNALSAAGIFSVSLRRYVQLKPLLVEQTYAGLKQLMLVEGERDLAASKTTLSSSHAATSTTLAQELAALRAENAALKAAQRQPKATAPSTTTPAPKFTAGTHHFCWTCGPQANHPSFACRCPSTGHDQRATSKDRRGSAHNWHEPVDSSSSSSSSVVPKCAVTDNQSGHSPLSLYSNTTTHSTLTTSTAHTIISDTGNSGPAHCIAPTHAHLLVNLTPCPANNPPQVRLPDGSIHSASHYGYLHIPALPMQACLSHVFPNFVGRSLLAVPTLCEHGCTVTYTHQAATVTLNDTVILQGTYDPTCRLWLHALPPPPPPVQSLNTVITHRNEADRVRWFHAAFWSPAIPTFKTALSKGLIRIPGLTTKQLEQNEPNPVAMHEGHLRRSRANVRSTSHQSKPVIASDSDISSKVSDSIPADEQLFAADNAAAPGLVLSAQSHTSYGPRIHSDAAGRFPIPSSSGTVHYLVSYDERSNYIHAEAMPDRSTTSYERAFTATLQLFHYDDKPNILRLDNELSNALTDAIKRKFAISIERAPPNNHRTLRAERAIAIWKDHFVAGLCTAPAAFPLREHDRLVPYANLTLNLLRESRTRPGVSAWEHIRGPINWDGCLFAPPGLAVLTFETKAQRGTWGPHGLESFFLGPALDAYRCHRVYVPSTNRDRTTDTVAWIPEPFRLPGSEPLELVAAAITDLTATLQASQQFPPDIQLAVNLLLPKLQPHLEALRNIFSTEAPPVAPAAMHPASTTPPSNQETERAEQAQELLPDTLPPPAPAQRVPSALPPPAKRVQFVLPAPEQRVPSVAILPPPAPEQRVGTLPAQPTPPPRIRDRHFHHGKRRTKPTAASTPVPTSPAVTPPTTTQRIRTPNHRYAQQVTTLIFEKGPNAPLHTAFPTLSAIQQLSHPPVITVATSASQSEQSKYLTMPSSASNDVLPSFRLLRQGPDGASWDRAGDAAINKLVTETGTMHFIPYDHTVSYCYYKPVCKMKKGDDGIARPHVRGTAADTQSTYDGPTAAHTAGLSTVKILLNSVVSTPDASFCTADVKDYYLGTPMAVAAYMLISLKQLSSTIIDKFNLRPLAYKNNVMVKITKGMYGLAQAGRLAQDRMVPHLAKHGYLQSTETPMLFKHATRPIAFTLIVDDFGIKYTDRADAEHLHAALRELYVITVDWSGDQYIGLHINHDKKAHIITISIPDYVNKAIKRFAPQLLNTQGKQAPMRYHPFVYGPHVAEAVPEDASPLLDDTRKRRLQGILGTFLYYARALDITAAFPVAKLASLPHTEHTDELATHFLSYMTAHPHAHVQFHRSDMQHNCHSDASFSGESQARSRAAGFHFLGHYDPTGTAPPNGSIEYISTIIDVIVASATEAELAAIFLNAQLAVSLRHALTFLGHKQGSSLIVSDNLVGVNILNGTAKSKRSRSMDLRFFWIKDRISQKQFQLSWAPGSQNLADYLTKIHPAKHYVALRPTFVSDLEPSPASPKTY